MAIEINNSTGSHLASVNAGGQTQGSQDAAPDKAKQNAATSTANSDQVSLTPQAQQLRNLEDQISKLPDVDTHKVNAIKDAIANGSFEINPDRIASKMMSLEHALGS